MLLHAACAVLRALDAVPPVAIHVNHGLQPAADDWALHCGQVAADFGATVVLRRVDVQRAGGESPEAAAREARHAALASAVAEHTADALLLAHHRDDQAETVLFNALRGTGLAGLAGMRVARALGQVTPGHGTSGRDVPDHGMLDHGMLDHGWRDQATPPLGPSSCSALLLRPFLDLPRTALEAAAHAHGLRWIEDPSNADTALRRNLLRRQVLPLIETGIPQARASLARLASHAAEAALLAADLADLDAAAWTDASGLRCAAFAELPPHRARNLLRRQLALAGLRMPDAARLDEMLRQLTGAGRPELRHESALVTRGQGRLRIEPLP
ncbi:MAG: tRNA lysidine(34) synthetase TilS [Rhodocyclaceae bacterium]|nr:tRNA lysidine(34) synthetase TilS [Rhodocyclaceae bacterium]